MVQTGQNVESKQLHKGNVMDLQLSKDGTHLITASTDMQAKLVDTESLEVMKTYSFERPCNSAAISPLYDHVRQSLTSSFDFFPFCLPLRIVVRDDASGLSFSHHSCPFMP